MSDQNRDNFYEGPPLSDEQHWHEGSAVEPRADADVPPAAEVDSTAGPYPLPEAIERPHQTPASTAEAPAPQPTRDPSMSRAADRAAAGVPVEDAGYDRSNDGPPPGPLEPRADEIEPES
ncbi:MAG TPA: hypothetical protein VNW68_05715 [Candidatus Limnocylindria bacterium]|jgi:hypothetical protein|nr:hypothetical protein [Candidatus Limnocylindria bacterium]